MENVDAAMRSLEPREIVLLRSSPRSRLMLSMISIAAGQSAIGWAPGTAESLLDGSLDLPGCGA